MASLLPLALATQNHLAWVHQSDCRCTLCTKECLFLLRSVARCAVLFHLRGVVSDTNLPVANYVGWSDYIGLSLLMVSACIGCAKQHSKIFLPLIIFLTIFLDGGNLANPWSTSRLETVCLGHQAIGFAPFWISGIALSVDCLWNAIIDTRM